MERLIDLVSLIKVASIVEHETKVALHFHLLLFFFFHPPKRLGKKQENILKKIIEKLYPEMNRKKYMLKRKKEKTRPLSPWIVKKKQKKVFFC